MVGETLHGQIAHTVDPGRQARQRYEPLSFGTYSVEKTGECKSAHEKAEKKLGFGFEGLKAKIDTMGGVKAARRLISSKDHFKSRFCFHRDNAMLDYTAEAFIVKYADAVSSTATKWRRPNGGFRMLTSQKRAIPSRTPNQEISVDPQLATNDFYGSVISTLGLGTAIKRGDSF